jgi:hypothetical protein
VGQDRQYCGVRGALGPHLGQDRMERVALVALQVQRQVDRGDQKIFQFPMGGP